MKIKIVPNTIKNSSRDMEVGEIAEIVEPLYRGNIILKCGEEGLSTCLVSLNDPRRFWTGNPNFQVKRIGKLKFEEDEE